MESGKQSGCFGVHSLVWTIKSNVEKYLLLLKCTLGLETWATGAPWNEAVLKYIWINVSLFYDAAWV